MSEVLLAAPATIHSKADLRAQLRPFLDEEPGDGDNLMDYGLTSIAAMQLVAQWKTAAIPVTFMDLAREPTIDGLWALLQRSAAA